MVQRQMATGCVPIRLYLQKQVASPEAVVCRLLLWSKANLSSLNRNNVGAATAAFLLALAYSVH